MQAGTATLRSRPPRRCSPGPVQAREVARLSSGVEEFDRVLGGGLVAAAWC